MKKILLIIPLAMLLLVCLSACRQNQRPPFLPPPERVPPPEMTWGVKTDYSGLTPYVPPHSKHTRLHDGPLNELIPSSNYGMLLPYSSATVLPDGSLRMSAYGLVTIDGVVVTDMIYSRVERAVNWHHTYVAGVSAPLPAYRITVNIPGTETEWGAEVRLAACALDGSWVTPLDYIEAVFTEDVIILMRSNEIVDIDVYDYNGRLLYNALQTSWVKNFSRDAWPWTFAYNVSEGYACLPGYDGRYFFVEVLTDKVRYTDYVGASTFSDGYAAVQTDSDQPLYNDGLWGFIDSDFKMVIPPRYVYQASFTKGRAVVEVPGGEIRVIDKSGKTLFSVPRGYWIERDYTGHGYSVHKMDGDGGMRFFTNDFVEIELPESARSSEFYSHINHLGDGWYFCSTDEGGVLFSREEEILFEGMGYISYKFGDAIVYSEYDVQGGRAGVKTLDGRDIILAEQGVTISPVVIENNVYAYIINTHTSFGYFGRVNTPYIPSAFRLVDTDGAEIASGAGMLSYDEYAGLYQVLGVDYFAWMDAYGKILVSIPHMSYTMD